MGEAMMAGVYILLGTFMLPVLVVPLLLHLFFKHAGSGEHLSDSELPPDEESTPGCRDKTEPDHPTVGPAAVADTPTKSPLSIIIYVLVGGVVGAIIGFLVMGSPNWRESFEFLYALVTAALLATIGMVVGAMLWVNSITTRKATSRRRTRAT
jgi:hypothetical protein